MHVITAQNELQSVIAAFEKCEFVTVDTEFIRETTYLARGLPDPDGGARRSPR